MSVKHVPDGFHTITPYLIVPDVQRCIDFMHNAFGATEQFRSPKPDGTIGHAEVQIGNSKVMLGQASGELKPMPSMLYMYVENCDAVYKQAVRAGGVSLQEPRTEFYGDRNAGIRDPSGNLWWIGTHVEDVSEEELHRRAQEQYK